MCGIAGYSGTFTESALQDAAGLLAHRGPDDSGAWLGHGVGLAHRRLSIIDVSPTGAQPMTSADGSIVLTFNGEIYNYQELRAELAAHGVAFRGTSDTEVLLHLYERHREAMLGRLNGIFAFALWDARAATLLVARDHLGVKPLYFAETAHGFAFASELKALLRLTPEMRELDLAAIHRYLTFLCCPGDGTPLRGVRKLGPGAALRVRAGRIERHWTWYQLPAFEGSVAAMTEQDAVSGALTHLRDAVHRQLVADVPVGAFLSGGLDSSSVVALAVEKAPGLRCFTIETLGDLEGGQTDDLPYAKRVAQHLGVPLEIVTIDAHRMVGDLERMVWALEEPLTDPATLNVLYISQHARRGGIKVLLSGTGGDNLFCGYRRHLAVQLERFWRWLPRPVRGAMERFSAGLNQNRTICRRLARAFSGAELDGDAHLAHYFRWIGQEQLLPLYSAEVRAHLLASEPVEAPLLEFLRPLPTGLSALERMLVLEQRFDLIDHNLTYTDKMGMAAGVEIRVPLLDTELVDFAARIPIGLKQRGRVGKWVLKRALEAYLPRDVIHRPKAGFGAPLRCWIRSDLQPAIADTLAPEVLRARGLFDPAAVERLVTRTRAGTVDGAYTLLSLICIELWCRQFLDGRPASMAAMASVDFGSTSTGLAGGTTR